MEIKIKSSNSLSVKIDDCTYYIDSRKCIYITIGDYTYYIDNSTGEHYVDVTNNITNETTILNPWNNHTQSSQLLS